MGNKIEKDEYELLRLFLNHEIKSYENQLDWYEKYEPNNKNIANTISIYIKRLRLLKIKLNNAIGESQE